MTYFQVPVALIDDTSVVNRHSINQSVFSMYFYALKEVMQCKTLDSYCKRHRITKSSSIVEFLRAMEYSALDFRMYRENMYSTYMHPFPIDGGPFLLESNQTIGAMTQTLKCGEEIMIFCVIYEPRVVKKQPVHHFEVVWQE